MWYVIIIENRAFCVSNILQEDVKRLICVADTYAQADICARAYNED